MKDTNEADVMGVRASGAEGDGLDARTTAALHGATVHDRQGIEVGEVLDVVERDDGTAESVVLEVGGYLGIGSRAVAVAAEHVAVREEDGSTRVILGMKEDELRDLPEYRLPVKSPVVPPHPR